MVEINFYKYQGAGNDFVLIDNRSSDFDPNPDIISKMCDRRFGIGADGLMTIESDQQYDFDLKYYNPDGSQSFCGNGSRCAVKFAHHLGIIDKTTTFLAHDGIHQATILEDGQVRLSMQNVQNVRPVLNGTFVDTGSPHYVQKVQNVEQVDVMQEGSSLRYNSAFGAEGTNVNFAEITHFGLKVRTFERGVENETFACGTGVTACALALSNQLTAPVRIGARGGMLEIDYKVAEDGSFTDIFLTGQAEQVFVGAGTF